MNKYEFDIKLYGNMGLEVYADSKEEAKEMVKNLLEGLSIKDLNIGEKKLDKIDIKTGNLESRIYDKERECER